MKRIIQKIVEQNALGELKQGTFAELYGGYIAEQEDISSKIAAIETELEDGNREAQNARLFVQTLRKYTEITELTREIVVDLFEKIVVHEATGDHRDGTREQMLDFYFRFVGQLPTSVCSL